MTPQEFIQRWANNPLTERGGAQAHFDDLCDLLGVAKPRDPDNYCFERGAKKAGGGDGWADVWKRGHFGWENKSPRRDLVKALEQLRAYAGNLDNPPLHIVCDRERIEIHTVFRGYPDEPRTILLKDIGDPSNLQTLRWVFTDPDKLRPLKSNAAITQDVAGEFANLAKSMRGRGLDAQQVAHFLTQCIFCMFAEDEGLLHDSPTENHAIFTALLKSAHLDTAKAVLRITRLFTAMQSDGGQYGNDSITWFNGGLFKKIDVPPLTLEDMGCLYRVADRNDWRAIDPTIFGTLFESGLDPSSRAELGAHFTDVATIRKIIDPLITIPLRAEWQVAKGSIAAAMAKFADSKDSLLNASKTRAQNAHRKAAENTYYAYMERLRNFRVLDAACGSGNFLYLALHALKDLEHAAQIDAEALGLQQQLGIECGTQNILGIEINEYAAELARVTVWIGDIQWCQRNGRPIHKRPVLHSLDSIEHRDALLAWPSAATGADPISGVSEANWPPADVLVGNPPFLGQRFQVRELGETYVKAVRDVYKSKVSGNVDLVCYWFVRALAALRANKLQSAGLVATNSIRGGDNRSVLTQICNHFPIFNAWADEDWVNQGAAVRVSLICFGRSSAQVQFDGVAVERINPDLTAVQPGEVNLDLTKTVRLPESTGAAFSGFQMNGSFNITYDVAKNWLDKPNPNGLSSALVLHPYANASDITKRSREEWLIDFTGFTEDEAALFELPFAHVLLLVKPERAKKREPYLLKKYWLHKRSSPDMREAIRPLPRFIATPMVSKYRVFVWLPTIRIPENAAIVTARADDTTFGILHSRFHELWSLKMCTWMGVGNDPRYTPTTCFETFPFPAGLTPHDTAHQQTETLPDGAVIPLLTPLLPFQSSNQPIAPVQQSSIATISVVSSATTAGTHTNAEAVAGQRVGVGFPPVQSPPGPVVENSASAALRAHAIAIAQAAKALDDRRTHWLNPPEWTQQVPEVIPLGMSASPYPDRTAVVQHSFCNFPNH